jgi:GNAT superfamily N-acetyltransferase
VIEIGQADKITMTRVWSKYWGRNVIVSRGVVHHVEEVQGFTALMDGELSGLITIRIRGDSCEIVSLNSFDERKGVGTALINHAIRVAREKNCRRVWLVTTNDNVSALGFYQKRGFDIVALHRNVVETARKIKTEIPLVGYNNIPIKHEIELDMML